VPECPIEAISPAGGKYVIDSGMCTDCGSCAEVCPVGAASTNCNVTVSISNNSYNCSVENVNVSGNNVPASYPVNVSGYAEGNVAVDSNSVNVSVTVSANSGNQNITVTDYNGNPMCSPVTAGTYTYSFSNVAVACASGIGIYINYGDCE
jgi:Fe-S-cluster-containing hydrogenase component 2